MKSHEIATGPKFDFSFESNIQPCFHTSSQQHRQNPLVVTRSEAMVMTAKGFQLMAEVWAVGAVLTDDEGSAWDFAGMLFSVCCFFCIPHCKPLFCYDTLHSLQSVFACHVSIQVLVSSISPTQSHCGISYISTESIQFVTIKDHTVTGKDRKEGEDRHNYWVKISSVAVPHLAGDYYSTTNGPACGLNAINRRPI